MRNLFHVPSGNAGPGPAPAAGPSRPRRWAVGAGLIALTWVSAAPAAAPQQQPPGATVESLLDFARQHNPEYQASRLDAATAEERIYPAGALPDPKFRNEFRDITKMDTQNPTLLPSRIGSNRYLLTQDVPWFGKRDLRRAVAQSNADAAQSVAKGVWAGIAARITSSFAQLYYVDRTTRLAREILDLMERLEQIAQVRYANGLAPQQDVVRAPVEQTSTRNELVALEGKKQRLQANLNGLLARPADAPLVEPQRLPPLPVPSKLDRTTIEARVRKHNPQLFADDARIRSAERSRELAYKNRHPDFTPGFSPIEYMQRAIERMKIVIPVTLLTIFLLIYLNFRRLTETLIVMLSVPFALVGGVWLMWALGYNLSVAVAVGFIALAGVAAETAVVMLIYLDSAWEKVKAECRATGQAPSVSHLYAAVMEGAVERVRPKMMTVVAIMAGLLPIMWESGTGSEVMRRIAAPMVGGMISSTVLTLAVIPAIYALVKQWRLSRGRET